MSTRAVVERDALKVGDVAVHRVEEMRQRLPLAAFGPAEMLASALATIPEGQSEGSEFQLVFQTWVFEVDGLRVVVDPCNGNGREHRILTQFHNLQTDWLERFADTGVHPADVDVVFCTHLHCDHCGWNTCREDGRFVPTFPNARYLLARREVERWNPANDIEPHIAYNDGVFEASVQPVIDAGQAELVEPEHRVSPSLTIAAAPGHTLGHSILKLTRPTGTGWFTGDMLHHAVQIADPALHMPGDFDDFEMAIATRRRLLGEIAELGALMIPAHFVAPHAGYVARAGEGFRFEPIARVG